MYKSQATSDLDFTDAVFIPQNVNSNKTIEIKMIFDAGATVRLKCPFGTVYLAKMS